MKLICCVTLPEIRRDIGLIRKFSSKIVLSGGEVTIYKNLMVVLAYCRKLGFDRIGVITNGRQLKTKPFLEKMIDAGVNDFAVSIYSLNPSLHEKITGKKGSCRETFCGICNLLEYSKRYPINVRINLVLNFYNYDDILNCLNQLHALGIRNFILAEQIAVNQKSRLLPLRKIRQSLNNLLDCSFENTSIILRGFAPCLFEKNKVLGIYDAGIVLRTKSARIILEKQNVDTFMKEDSRKKEYLVKFSNLFGKSGECLSCSYRFHCLGLQKMYFLNEKRKNYSN